MKNYLWIYTLAAMSALWFATENAHGANADKATSVTASLAGVAVKSPDDRKAISFTCIEGQLEYSIMEKGKPEMRLKSNNLCREIIALGWTGNSRTVVAIIKEDSLQKSEFIHWMSGNSEHFWRIQEVKPPSLWEQIETVTDCQPGTSAVEMTYRILRNITANDKSKYWSCRFTVNPVTGEFSNLKETPDM